MTSNIDPIDDDFPNQPHLDPPELNDGKYWVGTNKPVIETHYEPINRREMQRTDPDTADYLSSDEDLEDIK